MMVKSFVRDLQTLPLPSELIVNISFKGSVENVVASIILTFMDTDFHDKVPLSVLHTRVGKISTLFHSPQYSFFSFSARHNKIQIMDAWIVGHF